MIHTGGVAKGVYASFATPVYADLTKAKGFKPPVETFSVSSEQLYGNRTAADASASLGAGRFEVRLESGVGDGIVQLAGETLWIQFYPDQDVTNQVVLGAEQARVLFKKIRIDRDIHYTTDQGRHAVAQDCVVPPGHYFFLGDNSGESEDSRIFGPVPESDLVGRPFMIFYPLERIRFF